jgi:hypothetical protein
MRRFTRLTNAFSKKVENLARAVSLHYMHYNWRDRPCLEPPGDRGAAGLDELGVTGRAFLQPVDAKHHRLRVCNERFDDAR